MELLEKDEKQANVKWGVEGLLRLKSLARNPESPLIDPLSFASWCRAVDLRMRGDEEYRGKSNIRRVIIENRAILEKHESELHIATQSWRDHPLYDQFMMIRKSIEGAEKTITNMEEFLKSPPPTNPTENYLAKYSRTQASIEERRQGLVDLKNQFAQLKLTPEYLNLCDAEMNLNILESELGLKKLRGELSQSQRSQGGKRGERGKSFETVGAEVVERDLVPYLREKFEIALRDYPSPEIVLVKNITFGMASSGGSPAEFDILICVRTTRFEPQEKNRKDKHNTTNSSCGDFFNCLVLGVVEVKRNPDDLGTAFLGLQLALNWLCGKEGFYSSVDWVNKNYPSGHFDRPFIHTPQSLVFTQESFRLMTNNLFPESFDNYFEEGMRRSGLFCNDIFFVTKDVPYDNITSRDFNVVVHHLAVDLELNNLEDDTVIERFRQRILQRSKEELCTSKLLEFLESLDCVNQIIVVGR